MRCDYPFFVNGPTGERVPVPCGRCPNCKHRRVNEWVFRLMEQDKKESFSHFVTLTYDPDNIVLTKNGFMTLVKKDLQDFWKRLRKNTGESIKYYVCGEYGTKHKRPHYHAIVFGVSDPESFHKAWGKGDTFVGTVSGDSIAYTLKYIDKPTRVPEHSRDDRLKEFSLMSKGLGVSYLSDSVVKYHRSSLSNLYLTKLSGHKVPMPRFYRNKIWSLAERQQQVSVVQDAVSDAERRERMYYDDLGGRLSYERKKELERLERYRRFYHSSKQNRE